MKILVIGGSYFLGRVFTMYASQKHDLTLLNRGRYSLKELGVKEYHFDRHDIDKLKQINEDFDAVVDFCAYQKSDIEQIIENISGQIKHYIFISTCDVYQRDPSVLKDENYPLNTIHYQGEVGEYIDQKILLEKELVVVCQKHSIAYSSLRPANIYGPFNYAPRESLFIQMLVNEVPFIKLTHNDGHFQLVYVKDVAFAIIQVIEEKAYDQVYNIVSNEIINYTDFYNILEEVSKHEIKYIEMTYQQAMQQQYPLPYPITKEETMLYDGQKIVNDLHFKYTPLKIGMEKTYQAFLPLFEKR